MIGSPYAAEIDAEERSWYELASLVRSLTPDERLEPGYYRDPDWSVRDLVGHLGTWLAEAATQFDRIVAGTYTGHDDVDIDALNAQFLAAMVGQPWDVVWSQANAGRTVMLQAWTRLTTPNDEAGVVDPQVRGRPLRRPPGPAARLGRGAGRAPDRLGRAT